MNYLRLFSSNPRFAKRFFARFEVGDVADCWPWLGSTNEAGYGTLSGALATRIMFTLTHEEPLAGNLVCHSCDNSSCVNPSHLFLGSYADNAKDYWDKKRAGLIEPKAVRVENNKLLKSKALAVKFEKAKVRVQVNLLTVISSRVLLMKKFKKENDQIIATLSNKATLRQNKVISFLDQTSRKRSLLQFRRVS